MEEGVYLVCEALGVNADDDVAAADVCVLYENVLRHPTSTHLTQRAIAQVIGTNGGTSCRGGRVLEVLMEMERERERREELYWDHQLLRVPGTADSLPITPCCEHRQIKGRWCTCIWKLKVKARQLSIRLALESPWDVLPSLRHGNQIARKQEWPYSPSITQIPLLLQHKYDIIRERLYAEMLQDEHGGVWWESLSLQQQEECVFELGVLVERALSDRDLLSLCELPGAFRIYRQQVPQGGCGEEGEPRVQSWLARPQELAWTALVFLMELESFYQEEKRALSTLMTRVDQAVQCEVCVCLRLAVTRAQRETRSHAALLAARQNWETWPNVNTDARGEHLTTLFRQRDKYPGNNGTHNLQDLLDNQETRSECPANQSAETSMDNGDRLLMEETPYLEILCDRSQCDVQHDEPIAAGEGQGLEKQGSLIAAAWSDISEPANQDSPPQSPLDQDQEAVSEEEPVQEMPDLTHTLLTDAPATHTLLHAEDLQSLQTYTDIGDPQSQHAHLEPQKTHSEGSHMPITTGEEPEVCVESCAEADEGVCSVLIDQESVSTDEGSVCEEESVCGEDVCVEGVYETQEGVCPEVEEVCGAGESVFESQGSVCEHHEGASEEQEGECAEGASAELSNVCVASGCVCGEKECVCVQPMAVLEREETMRSLVDMQRKLELRHQRERERHTLRVQERLTIIQNRKSDDDLLGIKNLSAFTQEEDEQLQKMLVRERLEQLRRERSYILQTRRERNTAGFKELLGPTAQHSLRTED